MNAGPWGLRVLLPLSILALGAAPAARAWEPDVHQAIGRAALGISAAAEARVPLEYRDAFFREMAAPDYTDKECRYHAGATGAREAALLAEQALAMLKGPAATMKGYQKAQLLGRYLHFVMDAVAPAELRSESAPKLLNYFANRDFVIWREATPGLAGPLAAALRRRAEEMVWANVKSSTAVSAGFRCVVNATADALLLLPARDASAAAAKDEGPVWFLVNRMDNGTAGKATGGGWTKTGHTYDSNDFGQRWIDTSGGHDVWSWDPGSRGGGQSFKKLDMMERGGAQLVELAAREEPGRVLLRGVIFNNGDLCAEGIVVKAGGWSFTADPMPPHSVRRFEASGPADLMSRRLTSGYKAAQCPGLKIPPGAVSAARQVVVGLAGQTPRFEYAGQAVDITGGRRAAAPN